MPPSVYRVMALLCAVVAPVPSGTNPGPPGLVLPAAAPGSPTCTVVAIHDPRHTEPLLLATSPEVPPRARRDLYADRRPVEQLPLAGQQMLGAARQCVSEPETCHRLPELSLLAGAILSCAAATGPAVPTGTRDRRPRPTPGRLRRVPSQVPLPEGYPRPERVRRKAAVTEHLPKGSWGQRQRTTSRAEPPPDHGSTHNSAQIA